MATHTRRRKQPTERHPDFDTPAMRRVAAAQSAIDELTGKLEKAEAEKEAAVHDAMEGETPYGRVTRIARLLRFKDPSGVYKIQKREAARRSAKADKAA
jgi:hypothetical protein